MKKYFLLVNMLLIVSSGFSQNVGIGTTNPVATLDVKGNHHLGGLTRYISFDTLSGKILWTNSKLYVSNPQYIMQHSASAEGLYYGNSQLEYREPMGNPIFFTNWSNGQGYFSGKLGIGTTIPAFKLDVKNGSINTDSVYRIGTITVLSVRGTGNLFVGKNAGRINTGSNNTFSGETAGYSNTSGFGNTAYGFQALYSNINGAGNTAIGLQTLHNNIDGDGNIAIGDGALYYNTGGKYNTAIGYTSLYDNIDGWYNTSNGESALTRNSTGSWNTANGGQALSYNETGIKNTAIGYSTLSHNESGTLNTGVGYNSDVFTDGLTNATALGANARVNCSNCLVLGSVNGVQGAESNVNVGIGVNSPGARLSISTYGVELAGSAAGNTVRTNAGTLGTAVDSEMSLANFGFASGNNSSLGIRAYRTSPGADWTTTSLLLENDVDNTTRAGGGYVAISANGNIGIGTVRPLAQLHVTDKSVLFSASDDIPGTPGPPPIEGAGRRMMWYPDKAAFRVGYTVSDQWNLENIGVYSFAAGNKSIAIGFGAVALGTEVTAEGFGSAAFGSQTYATGDFSTTSGRYTHAQGDYSLAMGIGSYATGHISIAMGSEAYAPGTNSTAIGIGVTASGSSSTAMGGYTNAGGSYSTAMGFHSDASGDYATAIGSYTTAKAQESFSVGAYNDATDNPASPAPEDRIFQIGNGYSIFAPSNAITVLRNGNTGIGTLTPGFPLSFSTSMGEKISLWYDGNISGHNYGIGVQGGLFQIHGYTSGDDIAFGYGSSESFTEKMRIKGNGNVGIGISAPTFPLSFAAAVGDKISLWSNSGNSYGFGVQGSKLQIHTDVIAADIVFGYGSSAAFTETMRIRGNGKVGIGTMTPDQALTVVGDICATGWIATCSDIRYKTDLTPISNSLEKALQLHGLYYFLKTDEFPEKSFSDKRQIGFSAQELELQFPEIVQTDSKGYKSVDHSRMTPILLEAIKEQQKQIDALQKNDENQQQQINELKKLITELAAKK